MKYIIEVEHRAFERMQIEGWNVVAILRLEAQSINEALELAYVKTNTINEPWTDNPDIELSEAVLVRGGCRSTSVHDRMYVDDGDPLDLKVYDVDHVGFKYMGSLRKPRRVPIEDRRIDVD